MEKINPKKEEKELVSGIFGAVSGFAGLDFDCGSGSFSDDR